MAESSIELTTEKTEGDSNEQRIIDAARKDPQVFGELYLLYVEQVYRYLFSRVGNVHEAEDATAQTFLSAFESFGKFRQDGHFASWLFTIARNKALDTFRKRRPTSSIDEVDIPINNDPLYNIIQSEKAATLAKLIRTLSEDERELLRLRFLADLSFPEMAHFLHRNEDAVKKSTYRLLARLHRQVEVSNE